MSELLLITLGFGGFIEVWRWKWKFQRHAFMRIGGDLRRRTFSLCLNLSIGIRKGVFTIVLFVYNAKHKRGIELLTKRLNMQGGIWIFIEINIDVRFNNIKRLLSEKKRPQPDVTNSKETQSKIRIVAFSKTTRFNNLTRA